MADIFSQVLTDKITSAKEAKQGKHKEKIQVKILELQNFLPTLDQKKQSISDEESYQKYIKFLKEAIESTIEQITAPTVDDFIAWVEQVTDNKNTNYKAFRKYLISNFSDAVSIKIDSVLSAKNILEKENLLFSSLLSDANNAIKKDCNEFLKTPDEYANKIDDFLKNLDEDLSILGGKVELTYTTITELYSEEQKNNSIDFYADIISKIVEQNQSLKPINDAEKDDGWVNNFGKRIEDIKKCIKLLDDTNIANDANEDIKKIFLKFDDEIFDTKKGVVETLEGFIEKSWGEISDNYFTIKEYFDNAVKFSAKKEEWDSFPKKSKIVALLDDYNAIFTKNPLNTILKLTTKDIADVLNKSVKAIEKYKKSENELKIEVSDIFSNFAEDYSKNKIPQLDKLAEIDDSLLQQVQEIKDSIEGLENGIASLNSKDFITYLNEDFNSDLHTYNNITNGFTEVLQKSGMKPNLDWLSNLLNNADNSDIFEDDFDEEILKELLSKGLITLTITKTF